MAHLSTPGTPHIAIIGGGFAGTMTLAQLVRGAKSALRVTLIEKSPHLARGTAYSTPYPYHLLNVRTDRMGAFSDASQGFYHWLQSPFGKAAVEARCPQATIRADNYVPRLLYGAYLESILDDAHKEAVQKGIGVFLHQGEATNITLRGEGISIGLAGQDLPLEATHVVLATGNAPPRRFSFLAPAADHTALLEDIWAPAPYGLHHPRFAALGKSAHISIIGSGLTAVDAVLTLHQHGYAGKITLISRHGLLPAPHTEGFVPQAPQLTSASSPTALSLLASLRRQAKAFPGDWRALVDGVRPHTTALWRALSPTEKKRFLTRLFSFWNVHRHRMAPEIHDRLEALRANHTLSIVAGSIRTVKLASANQLQVTYRPALGAEDVSLTVDLLLNCAGPDYDVASPANPLLAGLCEKGLLIPSPLRWGVKLTPNGSAAGKAEGKIFPLGTLRIEEELECTAVPELRVQAKNVAEALLGSLV